MLPKPLDVAAAEDGEGVFPRQTLDNSHLNFDTVFMFRGAGGATRRKCKADRQTDKQNQKGAAPDS